MSKIDEFHYHEVLHLASVFEDIWDRYIDKSRAVEVEPKLRKQSDKIGELISDFYQTIGSISFDKFSKNHIGKKGD